MLRCAAPLRPARPRRRHMMRFIVLCTFLLVTGASRAAAHGQQQILSAPPSATSSASASSSSSSSLSDTLSHHAVALGGEARERAVALLDSAFGKGWSSDLSAAIVTTSRALMLWLRVLQKLLTAVLLFLYRYPEVALALGVGIVLWLLARLSVRLSRKVRDWVKSKAAACIRRIDHGMQVLRARSRAAALLLPQVLFWLLIARLMTHPEVYAYMGSARAIFFVSVAGPWLISLSCLLTTEAQAGGSTTARATSPTDGAAATDSNNSSNNEKTTNGKDSENASAFKLAVPDMPLLDPARLNDSRRVWLRHWVIVSVIYFIEEVPVVQSMLRSAPGWRQLQFVLALWAVLPWVDGGEHLHSAVTWLLERYYGQLQARALEVERDHSAKLTMMQTLLSAIFPRKMATFFRQVLDGGYVLFVAIPFLFAPRFMTHFGCAMTGCVLPAIMTSKSLLLDENVSAEARAEHHQWLTYWVVYVGFTVVHSIVELMFGGLPFWYDAELLVLVYLQLPFFNGAKKVFDTVRSRERMAALRDRLVYFGRRGVARVQRELELAAEEAARNRLALEAAKKKAEENKKKEAGNEEPKPEDGSAERRGNTAAARDGDATAAEVESVSALSPTGDEVEDVADGRSPLPTEAKDEDERGNTEGDGLRRRHPTTETREPE